MASDTSLVFNVMARDKASSVFRNIRRNAEQSSAGIAAALGPALLPVLASATVGAVGLAGALSGVGAAGAVFGAVFKSSFTEVQKAGEKTDQLRDKIQLLGEQAKLAPTADMRGKYLDQQAAAARELQARLNALPPATRTATVAYGGLKNAWKAFVDQNKPQTFGIMTGGFKLLTQIIPKLQPLFDVAAAAVRRLLGSLTAAGTGGGVERLVAWLTGQAGPAINNLGTIFKNLGITIGSAFSNFAPAGQGILTWAAKASAKLASFAQGGGFTRFMTYVQSSGPRVVSLFSSLVTAAVNIARAVTPLAPISLAVAGALAAIIAAVPPGVITALVAAWVAYTMALKAYQAYTLIVGAATKVWAAVQWVLNAAMAANPVVLIVLAIIALIAVIVLVATKTKFFQTVWAAVWGFMKTVGAWFAGPFANFFVALWNKLVAGFNWVKNGISSAINAVKAKFQLWGQAAVIVKDMIIAKFTSVVNWIKAAPGKIGSSLSNMFAPLWNGFKGFINKIIGGWNSLHFGIPGFSFAGISVPGVNVGVPHLPYLAKGGNVQQSGLAMVGERGPEVVSLQRGAQVTPLSRAGGGGRLVIDVTGADDDLIRLFRKWVRTRNLLQG